MRSAFSIQTVMLIPILIVLSLSPHARAIDTEALCETPGNWIMPSHQTSTITAHPTVMKSVSSADFVLLGEQHNLPNHHRWQTQMLATLLAQKGKIAIGLEMLPQSSQQSLDAWVSGELTLEEFISQSEWYDTWRFDIELYTPILHFARDNRVPLFALNVPGDLISAVSANGWENGSTGFEAYISKPSPASDRYKNDLVEIFEQHDGSDEKQIEHFIEAQLVWDRAFAEGLVRAREKTSRLVVGIIGSGHLTYGHGVKHQLNSLGEYQTTTWIPTESGDSCKALTLSNDGVGIADAIFVIAKGIDEISKHKLGIFLINGEGGVVVGDILENSIAQEAGIETNDVIIEAAGQQIVNSANLVRLIQDQAPGYWLPLTVKRGTQVIQILAKIPLQK